MTRTYGLIVIAVILALRGGHTSELLDQDAPYHDRGVVGPPQEDPGDSEASDRVDNSDNCNVALPCICRQVNTGAMYISCSSKGLKQLPYIGISLQVIGIWMGSNEISRLPVEAFINAKNTSQLDISNNKVDLVIQEGAFQGLQNLQRLILSNSRISYLPKYAFKGLVALKEVNLRGNALTELPASTAELTALETLTATHNLLTIFPGHLHNLTRLVMLDLSFNHITEVTHSGGPPALRKLRLQGNVLRHLPAAFLAPMASSLTDLWLDDNFLRQLPLNLVEFQALKTLSAPRNELSRLPEDAFAGDNATLTRLVLDHNKLTSLPSSVRGLTALQELNVNTNLLSRFPQDLFDDMTKLTQVNLGANRLDCDQLRALRASSKRHRVKFLFDTHLCVSLTPPPGGNSTDDPSAGSTTVPGTTVGKATVGATTVGEMSVTTETPTQAPINCNITDLGGLQVCAGLGVTHAECEAARCCFLAFSSGLQVCVRPPRT